MLTGIPVSDPHGNRRPRWRVDPGEPIFVRRIRYDLDEWSDLPEPEGYGMDPFRDSG